ncbi:MAG: hypothetical protein HKP06_01410 [Flavobacteriaceae bacterium]|nr:hypothetical protein [Flavobacteriaceae bacterium]
MKKGLYLLLTLAFLIMWSSCRKDFDLAPSTGTLEFSKDTVYLDTVFTNIGSSTYNLKVYNRSNNDISIPSIRLGLGDASEYRLNVDGLPGTEFEDIQVLAEDSIFIFIETTIDINNLPNINGEFLYTDAIEFDSGSNLQEVELVTLVKDATFIFPDRDGTTGIIETLTLDSNGEQVETEIQGRYLEDDELTFTNEKPYVIYGYAAIGANKTLNIDAGARVHFHANSGLIVTSQGSLHVNGLLSSDQELLENEVIFEGDRLEPGFSDVPGQWGTIWLFEGSIDNIINYATIKNATVGILNDGDQNAMTTDNKLTIANTQIYNSSNFGILGRATSIKAENLVINNSGQSSFAGTIGGKYNFTHCTIANYWNNSFRQFPSLLLNNFVLDEDNNATVNDLSEANFTNCIIYGNENIEILLDDLEEADFNFNFANSLIRFNDPNGNFNGNLNYDFENTVLYQNILTEGNPDFKDPSENQLMIGQESAAEGLGNLSAAALVPLDILGVSRVSTPDLGAYQSTIFEDED